MNYLIAAYGVIWLAVFAYALAANRVCGKLEKELESLKKGE